MSMPATPRHFHADGSVMRDIFPRRFINAEVISAANARLQAETTADYERLGKQLARRGIDIQTIATAVARFKVAIPSWGVGTGGTRFARFPAMGEPRNVFDKLDDCAVIHSLTGATPRVSLHLPWDHAKDIVALRECAVERD